MTNSTPYPHDAIVKSNLNSNTTEIARYDLKNKRFLQTLFADDTYDAGSFSWSKKRNYEIDYFAYTGQKQVVIPVSDTYKALHKRFENEFEGYAVSIVDRTEDEDKYLLMVDSDKLYGKYVLYDVTKDAFKELMDLKPWLKEEDVAAMEPIQFTSRDGLQLHGYLTLPNAYAQGKQVPLILLPHGGPYTVRDSWGFDSEVQLMASRGYAVLQVNFRGSAGYGKAFAEAGYKQAGRKMLDDLIDGVEYVKQHYAMYPDKVAVYGGSYGGLATLQALAAYPDFFVCGVDYVGLSNLFTMFESFPEYWKPFLAEEYEKWYDPNKPEEKAIMEVVSPAMNIDKLTRPLFVAQGANDPRVNIGHSDQIVSSLRAKGVDVPYMVKYNEGHGFQREENRIEFYKAMMGFLARHLKDGGTGGTK